MKFASLLLALLYGSACAAEYDSTKQLIYNDYFIMTLVSPEKWDQEIPFDDLVAVSKSCIDYWQDILGESHKPTESNRVSFSLNFAALGGNTLGRASSRYSITGSSQSDLSSSSYYGYTNESNGLGYNAIYFSEQKLKYGYVKTGYDFTVTMSSDFDFYYGSSTNFGNTMTDFHSVLLHEITHGMGFGSTVFKQGSDGGLGVNVYTDSSGNAVIDENGNTVFILSSFDTLILQNLEGNDPTQLTLGNQVNLGDAANGITIYNPSIYNSGSSISHISAESDPDALMNYAISKGTVKRELSAAELQIMAQMGYEIEVMPEPSSVLIVFTLLPLAATRRRRQAA